VNARPGSRVFDLWLCMILALLAATPALAEGPVPARAGNPSELAALIHPTARSLENAKAVRGRFVQKRHLAGLAQPLESRGAFLFARDAGIEWHTELPFDSQFVLAESHITQRDEGGAPLVLDAAEQPALAVVARVFFALFALDLEQLSQDFEMSGERRGAGWTLHLTPRAAALARVFRRAVITGGTTVESVVLEDGNGDRSEIELRDVSYDPRGLSAEESRRFKNP
jgi:hypothetical protein